MMVEKGFEALQEREGGLISFVDTLPFPAALYNERGEFVAINRAWCELSGYPARFLPSLEAWLSLATGVPKEIIKPTIAANFMLKQMTHKGEFKIRTASGGERIWDFCSGPAGEDRPGSRLVMSMAVDVTDRAQAEGVLREREEALARTGWKTGN